MKDVLLCAIGSFIAYGICKYFNANDFVLGYYTCLGGITCIYIVRDISEELKK